VATQLIDRKAELARIREAIANPPQLVVLRGRRRIGKSFLLAHAIGRSRGVFFQADEQGEQAHLEMLAREVARLLRPRVPLRFASWEEAMTTSSAAPAMMPAIMSIPELMMRPAANAVAVTAMAMRTTTSSRPKRPGAAFDLEFMALHFGFSPVPQAVPAPARHRQA
jgi:hypothetical protein